jgi:hypothetical protein
VYREHTKPLALQGGRMMGYEQLPPEVPTWSTGITTEDQNEIKRLEAERDILKEEFVRCQAGKNCSVLTSKDGVIEQLRDALDKLRTRHAALVKAANKFVKKIDMVHNDPAYYGVWATSQMHIGEYKGPKYDGELDELKAALSEVK